jgi:hypothetical protein
VNRLYGIGETADKILDRPLSGMMAALAQLASLAGKLLRFSSKHLREHSSLEKAARAETFVIDCGVYNLAEDETTLERQ